MKLIERLLFYPAALAATLFTLKLVFEHPAPPTYAALGAIAVFWVLVGFKVMYRLVKMLFWLALIGALGTYVYLQTRS